MKPTIGIREVQIGDIELVAKSIRKVDEKEAFLLTGMPVGYALAQSAASAEECYTGTVDGTPAAMFGVARKNDKCGVPWMLGTDVLVKSARHWIPQVIPMLDNWQERYPVLTNIVLTDNHKAIRWLQRMDFVFLDRPVPNHPGFIQFVRYR